MKMIRVIAAAIAFAISSAALAFMPAPGIWNFANENVGQPGRGMMIEVQNEVLFLSYFGYRADGSSVKYYAAGPIINNTFTSSMLDFVGGPVIAGPIRPAVLNGSIGNVTISFTSGTNGTMTLPGDTPRAIYKNSFGYAAGPDGLLGTWQMNMNLGVSNSTTGNYISGDLKTLNTKVGASSTYGNGVVTDSAQDFTCEFQSSGTLAGMVVCAEVPTAANSLAYVFKFSGDRGEGFGSYYTSATTMSSNSYGSHVLRTATQTGARTGINDATTTSIMVYSAPRPSMPESYSVTPHAREAASATQISSVVADPEHAAALAAWVSEVSAILPSN